MRVWMSAVVIAILAGALQAGNWPGQGDSHGDSHVTSGDGGGRDVALNGGTGVLVGGRKDEFAFVQLMRGTGVEVVRTVRRMKLTADRDVDEGIVDLATEHESDAVFRLGAVSLLGDRLTSGPRALRQVFDDISQNARALPAVNRFNVRVSFGF
jgi:hypothetical protein